jgi:hypothetical protein
MSRHEPLSSYSPLQARAGSDVVPDLGCLFFSCSQLRPRSNWVANVSSIQLVKQMAMGPWGRARTAGGETRRD